MPFSALRALVLGGFAAALAACGGGGDGEAEANLAEAERFLAGNLAADGVQVTNSGLQYRIVASGPPDGASPRPDQFVCVHYRGRLIDGAEFDSSYARGQPAAFPAGGLIAGWVEALAMMRPGDEWELFIHPRLGYGAEGVGADIGPNDALIFEVALLGVDDAPPPTGVDCAPS